MVFVCVNLYYIYLQLLFQDNLDKLVPERQNYSGFQWSKRWWGGSGIRWTICKSFAIHSRQITTPAPHHLIFYRQDAIRAAQPSVKTGMGRYGGTDCPELPKTSCVDCANPTRIWFPGGDGGIFRPAMMPSSHWSSNMVNIWHCKWRSFVCFIISFWKLCPRPWMGLCPWTHWGTSIPQTLWPGPPEPSNPPMPLAQPAVSKRWRHLC